MKPKPSILGALGIGFYACCAAAWAHHSIAADFDRNEYVKMEAVVQEFRFVNPHPTATATVVGKDGQEEEWTLMMDDLWELREFGFTRSTFQPGDELVVIGFRSRREQNALYIRHMARPADDFAWLHEGEDESIFQRAVDLASLD